MKKRLMPLALLVLIILTACSGAGSPSSSTTETDQSAATAVTQATPVAAPTSGAMATEGGMAMGDAMPDLATLQGAEFEIAFMDMMISHHQSAIEMSQVALERSQRDEVKAAAQAIIAAQQAEIEQMTTWLQDWHGRTPTGMDHGMAMPSEEMERLRTLPAEEFDAAFLQGMIPHHEDAIAMADLIAERTDRPELNQLAQAIQTTQRAEIEQFNAWLAEWAAGGN